MTSQIAVFNSLGVAVASDTVTTHGTGSSPKTTNNAEKIWTLGGEHLVAALHSGMVAVNSVNSRLFFNEWARTLSTPLKTLTEYPENFVKWMENNAELISPTSELELVHGLLNDHFYEIRNRTLNQLENDQQQAIPSVVLQTLAQDGLDYLQQLPLFPGTTDEHDAKLLENLEIDLNEKINYIFNIVEGFESSIQILIDSAPLVLSRAQDMEFDSLVSFVGFGQDDYFAKSIRTYLRGHYGGITRCRIGEPFGAESGDMSGSIATFAQSEAIHGFVRGAHVSMINEVCGFVWDTIYQMITDDTDVDTADKVTEELRLKIEESQRKKLFRRC